MEIRVDRNRFYPNRTVGQLYIDDNFFCFTLEDTMREVEGQPVAKWKVYGETAIPQGRYKITLADTLHFGPDTMFVNNVPGFTGILIHSGVTEKDTLGCILVGYKLTDEGLIVPSSTRPAKNDLRVKIRDAVDNGEQVWITIQNIK